MSAKNPTAELQRLTLALAVRGDLLARFPDAAAPELYDGAGQLTTPRMRVAAVLQSHWKEYGTVTPEVVGEMVAREAARLGPAEREAVEQEWRAVLGAEVPGDPRAVLDLLGEQLKVARLERALAPAGDAARAGESAAAVRERFIKATDSARGTTPEKEMAVMTVTDMLSVPDAETPWLWDRYLAPGTLNILSAPPKVGKSTFVYPLIIAVGTGRPFLGFRTARAPVLLLAVEEGKRSVRDRLRKFGASPTDGAIFGVTQRLKESPEVFAQLRRVIAERGIKLLVVDTISRFWKVEKENDNVETKKSLELFLDLAQETDVCVLVIHHVGKGGKIRGASAIEGIADQLITMERVDDAASSRRRRLKTLGRFDETPPNLIVALEGGEWVVADRRGGPRPGAGRKAIKSPAPAENQKPSRLRAV